MLITILFVFVFKVFLESPLIMNGVCVRFVGWLNTVKLDGMGYIKYDEERATVCHHFHGFALRLTFSI